MELIGLKYVCSHVTLCSEGCLDHDPLKALEQWMSSWEDITKYFCLNSSSRAVCSCWDWPRLWDGQACAQQPAAGHFHCTGLCVDGAELALPVLLLGPDVYQDLRGTTVLPSPSWGVTMTLHTPLLQLGLCRVWGVTPGLALYPMSQHGDGVMVSECSLLLHVVPVWHPAAHERLGSA